MWIFDTVCVFSVWCVGSIMLRSNVYFFRIVFEPENSFGLFWTVFCEKTDFSSNPTDLITNPPSSSSSFRLHMHRAGRDLEMDAGDLDFLLYSMFDLFWEREHVQMRMLWKAGTTPPHEICCAWLWQPKHRCAGIWLAFTDASAFPGFLTVWVKIKASV